MKKIISLILALVMVMGLAVGASAASITITTPSITASSPHVAPDKPPAIIPLREFVCIAIILIIFIISYF